MFRISIFGFRISVRGVSDFPYSGYTPPMDPLHRIVCDWCSGQSPPDSKSCVSCGAQLDIKNLVSDSGWREAPRLKDMSEVRFGSSICQVEGEIVPVAEI